MTILELTNMFPDDKEASEWIAKVRWRYGVQYPRCSGSDIHEGTKHHTMPYRCRICRRYFCVKTDTVMKGFLLGPQVWAVAAYLILQYTSRVFRVLVWRSIWESRRRRHGS